MLLGIRLLGTTFWCGLSNHQAATAQMHLVENSFVECPRLLGTLPLSLMSWPTPTTPMTWPYVYIYIYICYTYMNTYLSLYIYIYIIYIYIHIHTYIYTYTYILHTSWPRASRRVVALSSTVRRRCVLESMGTSKSYAYLLLLMCVCCCTLLLLYCLLCLLHCFVCLSFV